MAAEASAADQARDIEKQEQVSPSSGKQPHGGIISLLAVDAGEVYEPHPEKTPGWYQKLLDAGVEENGVKPVPLERRTNTSYNNIFTVFFTCLLSLLPWVTVGDFLTGKE